MQLCFVSVHGPRETYFVDEPHILLCLKCARFVLIFGSLGALYRSAGLRCLFPSAPVYVVCSRCYCRAFQAPHIDFTLLRGSYVEVSHHKGRIPQLPITHVS
jgi:hypothetical protein